MAPKFRPKSFQKSPQMVPKSTEIRPGGLQKVIKNFNNFRKANLGAIGKVFLASSDLKSALLVPFWSHLGVQNGTKIKKKAKKREVGKNIVFYLSFFTVRGWFWRGFGKFFSCPNFMQASQARLPKSLEYIGHGDKIKGPRFSNS